VKPTRYRITVRGRLTERLGPAFDGLTLEPGHEQTVLIGEIRHQADLYGVLCQVCNLGLEPVSVEADPAGRPGLTRRTSQQVSASA
jgi:hypothetical protein